MEKLSLLPRRNVDRRLGKGSKKDKEQSSIRNRLYQNKKLSLSLIHGPGVEDTTINNSNNNNNNNNNNNSNNRSEEEKEKQAFPPGSLGPPEPIRSLKIGESIAAYRYSYPLEDLKVSSEGGGDMERLISDFSIERVGYSPDAFILRNFLSKKECERIIADAKAQQLSPAETITEGDYQSRKRCEVSWLPSARNRNSPYVSSLVKAAANILLSRTVMSDEKAGVEDLQVLRYDIGGEFVLHQDGQNRILTVIYYVNGVAGTWFPLMRTSNDHNNDACSSLDEKEMFDKFRSARKEPRNKEQALKLGDGLEPGKHGLLIKGMPKKNCNGEDLETNNDHTVLVKRGDAVAFYNYVDDGTAELNWRAIHTGLPTTKNDGIKWIANHWFRSDSLADY